MVSTGVEVGAVSVRNALAGIPEGVTIVIELISVGRFDTVIAPATKRNIWVLR